MKTSLQYICIAVLFFGCKKSSFLEARPNQSQVSPSTLEDLQAILDNDQVMNGAGNYGIVPAFGEIGADNYHVSNEYYQSVLSPLYRNCYTWKKQLYAGEKILDWDFPYRSVFYSNVVLNTLASIQPIPSQQSTWNNEKGSALFYRAHMFYQLMQVFAPAYDKNTAATDKGIPLRLVADVNEDIQRASVEQTYRQIIDDLTQASSLLPVTPLYKTRPSKPAAFALLARVYQTMQDYDDALLYADSCLSLYHNLIDYNTFDANALCSFPRFNDEVIFNCTIQSAEVTPVLPTIALVDSILYASYDENDLRKTLFFKDLGGLTFLGTYDGNFYLFAGIATDEVYFIRAECEARKGDTQNAMNDLNTVLQKRWKTGTFIPFTATNSNDAMKIILSERRKELVMRGLRWTDLRRLNKDPELAVTLTRTIEGQTYSLPPNDPRYVYPIPYDVIGFNPGMEQNER